MKADPKGVLAGTHVISGNHACAEGAISAGCRFLGVYPVLPAQEISNRFLKRAKDVGATFIQMEDEISTLAAVLGASWTGKKSMTVTTGQGMSLMMEHLGLGVMLETPCVIVNIQTLGPGFGIPDFPAQGDIMQSRWGSHGDYEIIALAPGSPQEMFDFTIIAFNLSEQFRVPVIIMADTNIAAMKEPVVIPSADKIELKSRKYFGGDKNKYLPFKRDKDLIPPMVDIGNGFKFHVTGLTHDDRGYPVMTEECQEYNVHPLIYKIKNNENEIIDVEESHLEGTEVVIVSYGSTSRAALKAIEQSRKLKIKVGSLKLNTIWPFPEKIITEISKKVKAFVVPEMNFGQIVYEVERCSYGNANVFFVRHGDKGMENTDDILSAIGQAAEENKVKDTIIECN